MKTKTFCLLASLACGLALATDMVELTTQSHTPPTSLGKTIGITPANGLPLLLSAGWRIVPTVPPVADGWTRSQVLFVGGDGTNAVAQYTDVNIAEQDAAAASNAAAGIIAQAIAWTNSMTNAWLTEPVRQAAIDFRTVWTNYPALGAITNPAITYQAAIPLFMRQGTNVTQKQVTDCILWQWSYSQMASFLNQYFPPATNTWPNVQNAPWRLLP